MEIQDMKQIVLEISKQSFEEKLFAGTSGNLSVYNPESGLIAITPSGVSYTTMQVNDILIINVEGKVIEGTNKPSSEWRMHTTIYQSRPDINAVVHTHSPYATGFAVANKAIPAILVEMIPFIGGDIPVAEFGYPGTAELGHSALRVLHNRYSCLLANHGVLAIGKNIERAHICATYTEDAARICAHAQAVGEIKVIAKDVQNAMRRKYGIQEE